MMPSPSSHNREDVDIPSLFFHVRDLVYSSSTKPRAVPCDAFIYESENVEERPLGSIVVVGELDSEFPQSRHVLNYIASVMKKEYYRLPKRGPRRSFEAALQKTNTSLADYTLQGHTEWLGHLHALAASFDGNILRITRCGDARALLVRDGQIIDVTESLPHNPSAKTQPMKTFANVVTGALAPEDRCLFATRTLFLHLSQGELLQVLSHRGSADAVRELERRLRNQTDDQNFALSLVVANVSFQKEEDTARGDKHSSSVSLQDILDKESIEKNVEDRKPSPQLGSLPTDDTPTGLSHASRIADRQGEERAFDRERRHEVSGVASWWSTVHAGVGKNIRGTYSWVCVHVAPLFQQALQLLRLRRRHPSPPGESSDEQSSSLSERTLVYGGSSETPDDSSRHGDDLHSTSKGAPNGHSHVHIVFSGMFQRIRRVVRSFGTFFHTIPKRLLRSSLLMKIIASVILLCIIVFIVSLVFHRRNSEREERTQLFRDRSSSIERSLQDLEVNVIYKQEDQARALVATIEEQLKQLRELEHSEDLAADYERDLRDIQDKLDRIVRIDTPADLVVDLSSVSPGTNPREMFGYDGTIFVYDEQGAILSVHMNGGEAKRYDGPTSPIRHAAMMTTTGDFLFDTEDGVEAFNVESHELSPAEMDDTIGNDVRDLDAYGRFLYYIDTANDQIIRHTRTTSGLTSGLAWLKANEEIDFENVRGLTVSNSIFVLLNDGTIVRFLSGYQKETIQPKLSSPITDATRIYTTEDYEQLIILEPSKQRMLVFNSSGELQKQYTGEAFRNIKDVWIDISSQRMFVLAGSTIFEVTE